jgi:hypothetical protein
MKALRESGMAGVTAMNAINRVILRSAFMPLFVGTTLASGALAVIGVMHLGAPGALHLIAGGLLHVAGMFLVTMFFFGAALVAYLLLWALAPVASSTTDRLQMRGRPLNLASIDQGVRESIASIPRGTRSAVTQGITAAGSLIHLVVVLGDERAVIVSLGEAVAVEAE